MTANEATSFTDMMEALRQLDQHLEPATVSKFWLPGIDAKEAFADVVEVVPPEAMAWYAWHDGVDLKAAMQAYQNGRPSTTSISPDWFVHQGHAPILEDLRTSETPCRTEDEGANLFPIGSIQQGTAFLRQVPNTSTWRMCVCYPENGYRPGRFPTRCDDSPTTSRAEDNPVARLNISPTLLEWVTALNQGFESGSIKVKDGFVWTGIFGYFELSPKSYPWTWR